MMAVCSTRLIVSTDLLESQTLEQYRDWNYNGMKLVPKKVHRPEVLVDALKFQCLLRSALPRLPSYVELLRANDPQLDALISMENREGRSVSLLHSSSLLCSVSRVYIHYSILCTFFSYASYGYKVHSARLHVMACCICM